MQVMGASLEVNDLTYKEFKHNERWGHEDSHSEGWW